MKKAVSLILFMLVLTTTNAQKKPEDGTWAMIEEKSIEVNSKRQIIPKSYLTYKLNLPVLKENLSTALTEEKVLIDKSTCIITLPVPNGEIQQFRVVQSSIMEPELEMQFPNIKTYSIKGIDDPYANGKIDYNEFGFHAMVRSINGDFFVDPYSVGNTENYITYYLSNFEKDPSQKIPEVGVLTDDGQKKTNTSHKKKDGGEEKISSSNPPATCVGANLRKYRLAVACTGEYAVAATGNANPTIAQTLSKIVTTVNRVDGVFETEVVVRLVLVATETNVIFTNASTDPFLGNTTATLLINESQTVISNTIGTSNYDIGHTFSTGAGGLAGLGVVCINSQKARGVTGSSNPVGDPYDIDYVAHEIGHQFGGNHTFNSNTGQCGFNNRNAATAVEPGSGITLMAYAGICGTNDIANNSIPYFHAISYDEIVNFTNIQNGNSCAVTTTTGNNPPVVTGSGNYAILISTPFLLTGSATDSNNDALTYSWEETSVGVVGNWNANVKPYFCSYAPVTSPNIWFPLPALILAGNYTGVKGEFLPQTPQTLQFRLTARDNKMGGGGVCYAINTITVASAGPFSVTVPSASGIIWNSGSQNLVTWDVNGTNAAPIACDSVRILISLNAGQTYSTLIASTPNDGTQIVTAPTVSNTINTCRIKVESKGNIFFDGSNNNFSISTITGIKSTSGDANSFYVYPNPANSKINLVASSLQSTAKTEVQIVDLLGKVLLTKAFLGQTDLNESIDITEFTRGIYFISVVNGNKHFTTKLIKE